MKEQHDPVRSFLNSYWEARKETERLYRKIDELETQCTSCTAKLSAMPRGSKVGGGNTVWDALIDAKERAGENLKKSLEQEVEVETFINKLSDPVLRQLLKYRYLEFLTWERIAEEMNYGWRHIMRMHGLALKAAREVWLAEHPEEVTEYELCGD